MFHLLVPSSLHEVTIHPFVHLAIQEEFITEDQSGPDLGSARAAGGQVGTHRERCGRCGGALRPLEGGVRAPEKSPAGGRSVRRPGRDAAHGVATVGMSRVPHFLCVGRSSLQGRVAILSPRIHRITFSVF